MSPEIQASPEKIVQIGAVDICTSAFGSSANPAIVLLAGSWLNDLLDEEYFQQLAAGHNFVIRLDQRDTGRSATYPPGSAT